MPENMVQVHQSLNDFVLNFSSHGFQRIFYPIGSKPTKVSKFFRLVWFFAWGSAAVVMMYQMGETFQQFLRYEKITTLTITREKKIPFPAVTICNNNALLNDRVENFLENCNTTGIREVDYYCNLCEKHSWYPNG